MKFELDNIDFSYRSKVGVSDRLFERLSLSVNNGECVGIVGQEGVGKSTLLQIMDALLKPDKGKLFIDGKDVWQAPRKLHEIRRRIGFAFQFPEEQFFCETVEDELGFIAEKGNTAPDHSYQDYKNVLGEFGLSSKEYLPRSPFSLSMGEARLVALASLLMTNPQALLLDEPTAGLDGRGVDLVLSTLLRLKSRGLTIVIVSHDTNVLAELVSRVVVLEHSGIEIDLPARAFLTDTPMLLGYGFDVPDVIAFSRELRKKGYHIDEDCCTFEEAKQLIKALTSDRSRRDKQKS
ncbi:MAG: ATP-binding cassette domain-containing protein [Ignavibacteria bacterium]|nr:ATP-binding cassette domain-containing protein [Ignavibacteria bacterium]